MWTNLPSILDTFWIKANYVKDVLPSMRHKTEELFSGTISEFKTLGINIEDCREQSYYNAADMSDAYRVKLEAKHLWFCFRFLLCPQFSGNCQLPNLAQKLVASSCCFKKSIIFFVNSTQNWQKVMT